VEFVVNGCGTDADLRLIDRLERFDLVDLCKNRDLDRESAKVE
jgi:hypothetical protein